MNEEINFCLDLAREQMQESIDHLEISLSKIRAGKASPQMLRSVKVDYYGSITPLAQVTVAIFCNVSSSICTSTS